METHALIADFSDDPPEATMTQPKVGLITFGDHRTHEWEQVFKKMTEPRHAAGPGIL